MYVGRNRLLEGVPRDGSPGVDEVVRDGRVSPVVDDPVLQSRSEERVRLGISMHVGVIHLSGQDVLAVRGEVGDWADGVAGDVVPFQDGGIRRGHRRGPEVFLAVDLAVFGGRRGEEAVLFLELPRLDGDGRKRDALSLSVSLARRRREGAAVPLDLSLTTKWRRERAMILDMSLTRR